MSRRTVQDVMTAPVVTVAESTPFKGLATVMADRRVSVLPVRDRSGRVTGMVGEADLLPKEEVKDDPHAGRLPRWRRRRLRVKARGGTARDVMTPPAPTISPDDSVVAASRLMHRYGTRHLLVTGPTGQLAGIISRSDVMGVFLRSDEDIRTEVIQDVLTSYLRTNPVLVRVRVADGVVTLTGEVEAKSMIPAAVRMARSVEGVVAVATRLSYAVDDTRSPHPAEMSHH